MTSSAVRERPILFSGPMVRAIIEGRKTQTRRVMKLPANWEPGWEPLLAADGSCDVKWMSSPVPGVIKMGRTEWLKCPYGRLGDRLWVRETFATHPAAKEQTSAKGDVHVWGSPVYHATFGGGLKPVCEGFTNWKSSRFMPRWASRLTLEIVSVRVERIQDMSYQDWKADFCPSSIEAEKALATFIGATYQQEHSKALWDSINGKRDGCSWDAKPWVWVIEFKPVTP